MAKPLVAIVGRPNVGKSTFFNKMVGGRVAIVENTPGVTRDRIYGDVEWQNYVFTLIDTGGIDPYSEDPLLIQMRRQAEIAIELCDAIIFMVDAREGVTGSDEDVANLLRRTKKPVFLVCNKADTVALMQHASEFWALGLGEPYAISAANMLGLGDILEVVTDALPKHEAEEEEAPVQVAIVGKPNAGKSSIVNRILGEDRVMVSDIPGTTRDAVDTPFSIGDDHYMLIDTAGIRRKRAIEDDSLERYSVIRSLAAIRRSDVVVLVVDASEGVSEQDVRIAGYAMEEGKAVVVAINKWDILDKETGTLEKYQKQVLEELKFMDYVRVVFISAKTGQRVGQVLEAVKEAYAFACMRVSTGLLNDVFHDAQAIVPPPVDGGRKLKIFYVTQQSVKPPHFVLFVNDAVLMHYSYQRYLENHLRKTFAFTGTPVRFTLRNRDEKG